MGINIELQRRTIIQKVADMNRIVTLREDDIIYIKLLKNMDGNVDIFIDELKYTIHKLNSKARVLTDFSDTTQISSKTRRQIANAIKDQKPYIHKSVITGFNSPIKKAMIKMVLTFSRRHDIRLMQDKEEAIKWLLED